MLIALPFLSYFGGNPQLAGTPIFVSPIVPLSDEMMLCLRIGSVAITIAFFFLVGRFGVPLYMKSFGVNPSIFRIAVAAASPLIFIAFTTVLFVILLQVIQQDNFAKALYEYTEITIWPFAILPGIIGLLNGFRQPIPGAPPFPDEIKKDFKLIENGLQKLPSLINRSAGILDLALKGNYPAMIFSGLSVTAIAAAGMSNNPVTLVLLFVLPATIAVGSCVSYLLIGELQSIILGQSSRRQWQKLRFALFSVLLLPGLLLVSIGCIVSVAYVVNALYIDSAIPMAQLLHEVSENSEQGIAYAIVLLIPMYWILYFLYQW